VDRPYLYDYVTEAKVIGNLKKDVLAAWDKASQSTGNIRGLNLATVGLTTILVTKLPM
jgi:hypothetical protein